MRPRLVVALAVALETGGHLTGPAPALAQTTPSVPNADPRGFLDFAVSSASLQAQASALAVRREPRPEVKTFASEMVAFREEQALRLQGLAREKGWPLPAIKDFEHQVVLENLEPLDYLALSRRYAELQVQALEQEVRAYEATERLTDDAVKRLAQDALPALRQRLDGARQLQKAVGP